MQSPSHHPVPHPVLSLMAEEHVDAAVQNTPSTSSSSLSATATSTTTTTSASQWSAPLTPKIQNKRRSISFCHSSSSSSLAMPTIVPWHDANQSDGSGGYAIHDSYSSATTTPDSSYSNKNLHPTLKYYHDDDHPVTSPTSSSSSSSMSDSFDCQSLQRSLKRVRLTPIASPSSSSSSASVVSRSSSSPMSLALPRTVKKSSPGQLRLQRDIQYATCQGLWKPIRSVVETDATTGSPSHHDHHHHRMEDDHNHADADTNVHRTTHWEIVHHRHTYRDSNVSVTLTHFTGSCPIDHIDPTTTVELILKIHLWSTSGSSIHHRRDLDHEENSNSVVANHHHHTGTNVVQIILHIPRLYPHVPPTIDRLDYSYQHDIHHHHLNYVRHSQPQLSEASKLKRAFRKTHYHFATRLHPESSSKITTSSSCAQRLKPTVDEGNSIRQM